MPRPTNRRVAADERADGLIRDDQREVRRAELALDEVAEVLVVEVEQLSERREPLVRTMAKRERLFLEGLGPTLGDARLLVGTEFEEDGKLLQSAVEESSKHRRGSLQRGRWPPLVETRRAVDVGLACGTDTRAAAAGIYSAESEPLARKLLANGVCRPG